VWSCWLVARSAASELSGTGGWLKGSIDGIAERGGAVILAAAG
jgi:hypothetical protein